MNNRVYEMVPVNQEVSLSNGNIGKERAKVVEYQKLIMQKKNYSVILINLVLV